ncbi:hypothetical protein TRV_01302 [Trichophyton verrucosum HKI 0517]|uniref:Uncharacterized protein n=1 Tax=Trichophyton verrucosum (strain HKI 0517) TaxID=663202 RepID=D4D2J7_TRIVH|nr:uncharacterized protein TRV_01302 [Trichophyton verrucosum HKI 0517]EFE43923.1 hypothetical protein TRV_01302 [Trichophyton verrucosum HKI 0517]
MIGLNSHGLQCDQQQRKQQASRKEKKGGKPSEAALSFFDLSLLFKCLGRPPYLTPSRRSCHCLVHVCDDPGTRNHIRQKTKWGHPTLDISKMRAVYDGRTEWPPEIDSQKVKN